MHAVPPYRNRLAVVWQRETRETRHHPEAAMSDRYGSKLYAKEFVDTLPKPEAAETRPLLQLLCGDHADPEAEIERIERWYGELDGPVDRKAALAGNLRSLKSRQFWSALSELMTSRVLGEFGCSVAFEAPIASLTPDFLARHHQGQEFVVEVLTAFEEEEYRRMDADLHYIANALAEIHHRTAVFLDEVDLPATRPSLKSFLNRVATWLETCNPDKPAQLCLSPADVGFSVRLSTVGARPEPGPIIEGVVGPGGEISTHQTIRDALRRKSQKYRAVKDVGLPLVIFVWQGTWLHVNSTSLEWALFGPPRATFARTRQGIGDAKWDRAPGGLFGFGADGWSDPQHTRLSAVMYCERMWQAGRVYARPRLYHHPFAALPLGVDVFRRIPQFVPAEVTAELVTLQWLDEQADGPVLLP